MSANVSTVSSTPENRAVALLNQGRIDAALEAATSELSRVRHEAEDDPAQLPRLVSSLEILGNVQRELGDVAGSEASYNEALEVAGQTEVPRVQLAQIRTHLATLLDFSQREAEAVPLYEQAISDYESLDHGDNEMAAQLRNNLAMIYKGAGRFALAEQHYLRALETLESRRGRQSEAVASVYNNLGSLYYTAGFAEQAKEMFLEGLHIREALLGPEHEDVAQSYCNLATATHELGDNAASVNHFEQALRILERHLRDEEDSYKTTGWDYIALLESLGEERKAAAFKKRMEKLLGGAQERR